MSLLKEKLSSAFRSSSSSDNNKSRVTSNQSLLQNNAQLSLLYQLEQRKVQKLEEQNRALLERIQSLTTEEDEARIHALVADRTKRKLIHLKSIAKRAISSLEAGIKEFDAFINDVDEGIQEQTKSGAMDKHVDMVNTLQPVNTMKAFAPNLKRTESPVISEAVETLFAASVDRLSTISDKLGSQEQNVVPTTSAVIPTKDKEDVADGKVESAEEEEKVEEEKIEDEAEKVEAEEEKRIEVVGEGEEARGLPSTVTRRVKRCVNQSESCGDESSSSSVVDLEKENKKEEEEAIAVAKEDKEKKDGTLVSVTLLPDSQLSEDISFSDALHGPVKFNPPVATSDGKATRGSIGGEDRSPSFIHVTVTNFSPPFSSTPKPRLPKRSSTGQLFGTLARKSSTMADPKAALPPLSRDMKKAIIRDAAATATDRHPTMKYISIRPPRSASQQLSPVEAKDEEVSTAGSSQQGMPPPPLPKRRRRDNDATDNDDGRMTRSVSQQRTQKSEDREDETVGADGSSTLTSMKLGGGGRMDAKEGDGEKQRISRPADKEKKRVGVWEEPEATTSMMSVASNLTTDNGRARRAVAGKVVSYQLPPLNRKLRRE